MNPIYAQPYRSFFAVGAFAAALGVLIWIPYGFGWMETYPGMLHSQIMMGLFLNCFVSGFLMTAIPRMTQSSLPTSRELRAQALGLSIVATLTFSSAGPVAFHSAMLFSLAILFRFCARRILRRKQALPEVFGFVLFGLGSAIAGSLLWILGFAEISTRLFFLNFILCLVLGIGMRLVPVLLRLGPKPAAPTWEIFLSAFLVTAASVVEIYVHELGGNLLRCLVATWIISVRWRLFERAGPGAGLHWGVRVAAVAVLSGLWTTTLWPEYRLDGLHLLYIGGFAMMTFMVASRVILAHGGYELALEQDNWHIRIPVFLFSLAAVTRAAAPLIPEGYERHLGFAAVAFFIGWLVWAKYFVPKLFTATSSAEK